MSRSVLRAQNPPRASVSRRWRPVPWAAGAILAVAAAAAAAAAALPAAAATAPTATAGLVPGNAVAGFGQNNQGQMGNGTAGPASTPVLRPVLATLPPGTRITQVAPGCTHSLALTSTGTVLAWGSNSAGELGTGTTSDFSVTPVPVKLPAGVRITSVSGGCLFSLAVSSGGQVYAWGVNNTGQLGNGQRIGGLSATPGLVELPAGVRIRTAAAGEDHALAVATTGQVYAWGGNDAGQLGTGSAGPATSTPAPVQLPAGVRVTTVTAGERDSLAVTTRGRVLGWGAESFGALGDGHDNGIATHPVPAQLPPFVRVRSVFAGCFHTLAVTTDGSVFGFGANASGELGNGRLESSSVPVRTHLPAGTRVAAVGGGCQHSVAVTSRGQLLAWGQGGLLGNGSTALSTVPVPVLLDPGQIAVGTGGSAEGNHSLALVLRLTGR